jgi:hypothetical protein
MKLLMRKRERRKALMFCEGGKVISFREFMGFAFIGDGSLSVLIIRKQIYERMQQMQFYRFAHGKSFRWKTFSRHEIEYEGNSVLFIGN